MTNGTLALVFGVLFGVSEALAAIPVVKSNSIFQLVSGILASLVGKNPDGSPKG